MVSIRGPWVWLGLGSRYGLVGRSWLGWVGAAHLLADAGQGAAFPAAEPRGLHHSGGLQRNAWRHTLRVHAGDIERFQPGFAWDGAAPGHTAYLVQHADETVSVVLVHDAGNGVAQVELDYVTPRFRDFSPGEFVYRRSGLFRDRGFRKVITPAGMVAPYYD